MIDTNHGLLEFIEEQGWQGRIVSLDHVADLQDVIEKTQETGPSNESVYEDILGWIVFDHRKYLSTAKSIIIVAVPTPQMRIHVQWRGERIPVVVPPTYVNYTQRAKQVQATLAGWLKKDGYDLAEMRLPLKTLAVRSGLAEYGRNNICYVSGMGSFLQLVGALTDMPTTNDSWATPKVLDRCAKCTACQHACPTEAIAEDRFILDAGRCLTYHNEGADDFANWINPSWHHCLIGCMRCQETCPENKHVRDWIQERGEFTEKETTALVEEVPVDELPPETATKLRNLGLNELHRLLCRNLRALLSAQSTDAQRTE